MKQLIKRIAMITLFLTMIMVFSSCGNPASGTISPSETQFDPGEEMLENIRNSLSGSEGEEPAVMIELISCLDVGVIHTIKGDTEIEHFLNWLDGLEVETVYFEKGKSPGDLDGGAGYEFTSGSEEFYCRQIDNNYYIRYKDNWYRINDEKEPYWV